MNNLKYFFAFAILAYLAQAERVLTVTFMNSSPDLSDAGRALAWAQDGITRFNEAARVRGTPTFRLELKLFLTLPGGYFHDGVDCSLDDTTCHNKCRQYSNTLLPDQKADISFCVVPLLRRSTSTVGYGSNGVAVCSFNDDVWEGDKSSCFAHEVGHALGASHDSTESCDSVMCPDVTRRKTFFTAGSLTQMNSHVTTIDAGTEHHKIDACYHHVVGEYVVPRWVPGFETDCFPTEALAKAACGVLPHCGGINKDFWCEGSGWTLRKGPEIVYGGSAAQELFQKIDCDDVVQIWTYSVLMQLKADDIAPPDYYANKAQIKSQLVLELSLTETQISLSLEDLGWDRRLLAGDQPLTIFARIQMNDDEVDDVAATLGDQDALIGALSQATDITFSGMEVGNVTENAFCPTSVVPNDSSVSCEAHCTDLGYIAGQQMRDYKCRCRSFIPETDTCSTTPLPLALESVHNNERVCYYDVCTIDASDVTVSPTLVPTAEPTDNRCPDMSGCFTLSFDSRKFAIFVPVPGEDRCTYEVFSGSKAGGVNAASPSNPTHIHFELLFSDAPQMRFGWYQPPGTNFDWTNFNLHTVVDGGVHGKTDLVFHNGGVYRNSGYDAIPGCGIVPADSMSPTAVPTQVPTHGPTESSTGSCETLISSEHEFDGTGLDHLNFGPFPNGWQPSSWSVTVNAKYRQCSDSSSCSRGAHIFNSNGNTVDIMIDNYESQSDIQVLCGLSWWNSGVKMDANVYTEIRVVHDGSTLTLYKDGVNSASISKTCQWLSQDSRIPGPWVGEGFNGWVNHAERCNLEVEDDLCAVGPTEDQLTQGGYGCNTNPRSDCVNGNLPIDTLDQAWTQCGALPECTSILKYWDGKYYLRGDNDVFGTFASWSYIPYNCQKSTVAPTQIPTPSPTSSPSPAPTDSPTDDPCKTNGPTEAQLTRGGYGCNTNPRSDCVNGNVPIDTLDQAWTRCGELLECTSILKYWDGKYYLRGDNDLFGDFASWSYIPYNCQKTTATCTDQHLFQGACNDAWDGITVGKNGATFDLNSNVADAAACRADCLARSGLQRTFFAFKASDGLNREGNNCACYTGATCNNDAVSGAVGWEAYQITCPPEDVDTNTLTRLGAGRCKANGSMLPLTNYVTRTSKTQCLSDCEADPNCIAAMPAYDYYCQHYMTADVAGGLVDDFKANYQTQWECYAKSKPDQVVTMQMTAQGMSEADFNAQKADVAASMASELGVTTGQIELSLVPFQRRLLVAKDQGLEIYARINARDEDMQMINSKTADMEAFSKKLSENVDGVSFEVKTLEVQPFEQPNSTNSSTSSDKETKGISTIVFAVVSLVCLFVGVGGGIAGYACFIQKPETPQNAGADLEMGSKRLPEIQDDVSLEKLYNAASNSNGGTTLGADQESRGL